MLDQKYVTDPPDAYLKKAEALMREFHIELRDTYSPDWNFDDAITNGRLNGPRLVRIDWVDSPDTAQTASKIYPLESKKSAAYDSARITIPNKFKNQLRTDPIVHECVHFLQHNTLELDALYVRNTPDNYPVYVAQRPELEAHVVQLQYMLTEPAWRNAMLSPDEQLSIQKTLNGIKAGAELNTALEWIRFCHTRGFL
jgi:hypothetical protein